VVTSKFWRHYNQRRWSYPCHNSTEQERAELNQLWQQRLERAALRQKRAGKHYRLVEPENRLRLDSTRMG